MMFKAWQINDRPVALTIDASPAGPVALSSWSAQIGLRSWHVPATGSALVLPTAPARVTWGHVHAQLLAGCYAQVPGGSHVDGGAGLVIYTPAYVGLTQIGGPVEAVGRLHYIDGCSDSLLVCPAVVGAPCLNLLHLPSGIDQTAHTHPSDRIGIILRGRGECRTPEGTRPLVPGMFWHIPTGCVHSFHTGPDESLDVLAWHPDSDFGPSHDWHPMLNRTIVGGVSAAHETHRAIRTTHARE